MDEFKQFTEGVQGYFYHHDDFLEVVRNAQIRGYVIDCVTINPLNILEPQSNGYSLIMHEDEEAAYSYSYAAVPFNYEIAMNLYLLKAEIIGFDPAGSQSVNMGTLFVRMPLVSNEKYNSLSKLGDGFKRFDSQMRIPLNTDSESFKEVLEGLRKRGYRLDGYLYNTNFESIEDDSPDYYMYASKDDFADTYHYVVLISNNRILRFIADNFASVVGCFVHPDFERNWFDTCLLVRYSSIIQDPDYFGLEKLPSFV